MNRRAALHPVFVAALLGGGVAAGPTTPARGEAPAIPAATGSRPRLAPADSLRRLEGLRRRVRLDRLDLQARRDLADLLAPSVDIELRREAMEALDEAVHIDSQDPDLWIRVARLQERRGFKEEARGAFERALAMAPERADLWDELSRHDFLQFQVTDRWSFLDDARGANLRALAADPQRTSALQRGVRMAAILGDRQGLDSLLTRWEEADPEGPWPLMVRGMLHVEMGGWSLAQDCFTRGIARFSKKTQEAFVRLDRVDPLAEEQRENARDPRRFVDDYWRWRDPTPADPVNPRLLEHYRRMVEAELFFALDDLGVRGWDHAPGEMIVRYGLPPKWNYRHNVVRARTYQVPNGVAAPTIEVTYGAEDSPLAFTFVDYNLSGRYFNPIEAAPREEDFMLLTEPVLYRAPFAAHDRTQEVELWRFVDGAGKGRVEVAVALDPEAWPKEILEAPHRLATQLTLYDPRWTVEDAAVGSWASFTTDGEGRLVGLFELEGRADSAVVGLETRDREQQGRAASFAALSRLDTYGALLLSDLAFLTEVSFDGRRPEYHRGYASGLPNPGHRYRGGEPVGIAFEGYGFRPDPGGSVRARVSVQVGLDTPRGWFAVLVRGRDRGPQAELVFDATQPGTRLEQVLAIDVPPLDPGTYILRVRVEDMVAGTSAERSAKFTVLEPGKRR